jgi:hypothetical protein
MGAPGGHDVVMWSDRPAPAATARSLLATSEIMAGVTLAHTWAGGMLPSVPWLLGVAALVLAATVVLTRQRASLLWMVLGLGVAQALLHGFLTLMAPTAVAHGDMANGPHLDLSWRMVVAHAASAVITGVVWRTRRRLLQSISSWPALPARPCQARTPVLPKSQASPQRARWLLCAPWRGPPTRTRHA